MTHIIIIFWNHEVFLPIIDPTHKHPALLGWGEKDRDKVKLLNMYYVLKLCESVCIHDYSFKQLSTTPKM